ncbi:MAG TPA: DUF1289 domain-containing protein [Rhodanobacteraceae bacterium]|nr:DUF1289 domain-containing protein [Rhodanobacteraceae bacterium]
MSIEVPAGAPVAPVTPCVGVCRMDDGGLCLGCRRTLAEIAGWSRLDDAERRRWMREVRPRRPPALP